MGESEAAAPARLRLFAPSRRRHLLVVRRDDPTLHRYLVDAFRDVSGVEVVLDRREHSASDGSPPAERRHGPAGFDVFGVLMVRR